MFDNFSGKITKIFDTISGKKFISEDDLNATMREIRIALLEADVSLSIAKEFIEKVKAEALGQQVVKSGFVARVWGGREQQQMPSFIFSQALQEFKPQLLACPTAGAGVGFVHDDAFGRDR